MKKLLYTFLAVSIIFSACKKEEDDVVTPVAASIVGIWTPTSVDIDSSLTTTINGEIIYEMDGELMTYSGSQTMTAEEADFDGELEFTSDGKMLVDGDEMDYTYSNSVLTVTDDETTMQWACSVTSTNLSITIEESMDTTISQPGMDITVSAYYGQTINCSRNTAVNTNVNQRIGNTNHSWFLKPKFNTTKLINSIKQK